jgi:hypothetical protein
MESVGATKDRQISPTDSASCIITGTIIAVKATLSRSAEFIADTHVTNAIEKYLRRKRRKKKTVNPNVREVGKMGKCAIYTSI